MRLVTDASESDGDVCVLVEDNCILIWNLGYPLLKVFILFYSYFIVFGVNVE